MNFFNEGCYGDSSRGIYLGEHIQDIAEENGWNGPKQDSNSEFYDDATDEAIEFLNENTQFPENSFWGYNDNGDFGVWENDDE